MATPVPTPTPSAIALATIRRAAQHNTASTTVPGLAVYAAAGVTGLQSLNLASYNSALDSAAVNGSAANTTAKVQNMVNAYNAILTQTEGFNGVPLPTPTAAQFAAIGVTGLQGFSNASAVHLLDDALFGIGSAKADTVAEVQAMADAAKHLLAAAGGNAHQAAALHVADFENLGIKGVTSSNLSAAQTLVRASTDADPSNTQAIQHLVNAHFAPNQEAALGVILASAGNNSANAVRVGADVYAAAGVHGVDSGNLASINSALNSAPITGTEALSSSLVQTIVDSYNAILTSADGVAGNTAVALTAAQFKAVGVTGVSGSATEGTALHLLDDVVDASARSAVATVPELQAMATAAAHIIAAAGGTAASAAAVTAADFKALGFYGMEFVNLNGFHAALQALTSSTAVDTKAELDAFIKAHYPNDFDTTHLQHVSPVPVAMPMDTTTLHAPPVLN